MYYFVIFQKNSYEIKKKKSLNEPSLCWEALIAPCLVENSPRPWAFCSCSSLNQPFGFLVSSPIRLLGSVLGSTCRMLWPLCLNSTWPKRMDKWRRGPGCGSQMGRVGAMAGRVVFLGKAMERSLDLNPDCTTDQSATPELTPVRWP